MKRIDYRLYLVTDDPSRYVGDWVENVVAAVEGGVTCVQYRDTESACSVQFERIKRLQDALKAYKVPIIVNNDAELAAAVKAEGVHVGQGDRPPEEVRKIVGPDVEIGLSITCLADLSRRGQTSVSVGGQTPIGMRGQSLGVRGQSLGVGGQTWVGGQTLVSVYGIGPVYDATKTKRDAAAAMGCSGLKEIVKALEGAQTVAIGGITLERAPEVVATGVGGLAVVSAFSKADDPYEVARRFRFGLKGLAT